MQVVACKPEHATNKEIFAGVVLSVYRGSICRRGKNAGKVKVSKLMSNSLPAASAVKVHLLALRWVEGSTFEASPLSEVFVLDPAGSILGELKMSSLKTGSVTLRVTLEESAKQSLESVQADKKKLLGSPGMSEASHDPVQKGAKALPQFRSAADLTKSAAPQIIRKFMEGLPGRYKACNISLIDSAGMITLEGAGCKHRGVWYFMVFLRISMYFPLFFMVYEGLCAERFGIYMNL